MRISQLFILIISSIVLQKCTVPSISDIELNGNYAVPLVNSKLKIAEFLNSNSNTNIKVNSDGTLSLLYNTQLINQSISELLPSISSIGEILIQDTIVKFPLNTSDDFILQKAIFMGDEMRFRYTSIIPEDISINMKIPELTLDGKMLNFDFVLKYNGEIPFTAFTESIDLNGYEFNSSDNNLTIKYDARTQAGQRILLDYAAMSFNELVFSYGEGSAKRTENSLLGNLVPINVFSAWKSGILEFDDPKINFTIAHSYGFPISLRINAVELTLLDGSVKQLSGSMVGNEIAVNFPSNNEIDVLKETSFTFDKSNSNINVLFNEKVKTVDYRVDAILNPSDDLEIVGFVTDKSNFTLDVDVELPLRQKIQDLVIKDTIEIGELDFGKISNAEFKIITSNSYPVSLKFKMIFLDETNNELFRFFETEPYVLDAGKLQNDGTTVQSEEVIRFQNLNAEDLAKLKLARKVFIESEFDNSNPDFEFLTFYSNQYLELRMGLIFSL